MDDAQPSAQPDGPVCVFNLATVGAARRLARTLGPTPAWVSRRRSKLDALEVVMGTSLVSRDPEVMSGALCFTGTRVPVQNLFDYLEGNSSLEDFLEDFPSIKRDQAVAVLEMARERLYADAPAA